MTDSLELLLGAAASRNDMAEVLVRNQCHTVKRKYNTATGDISTGVALVLRDGIRMLVFAS